LKFIVYAFKLSSESILGCGIQHLCSDSRRVWTPVYLITNINISITLIASVPHSHIPTYKKEQDISYITNHPSNIELAGHGSWYGSGKTKTIDRVKKNSPKPYPMPLGPVWLIHSQP